MSTIQVRKPDFDFSGVPPRWAPNLRVVHRMNASGMIPAYIEPYLIKVMRMARAQLDVRQYPGLIADIDAFIRQEAQHYKLHASLNAVIRNSGYDRMEEFERSYAADYDEFLKKPLRWQLAYCDGFEAMGSATAALTVGPDYAKQFGEGADPRPIELWKWHIAEEYEHRNVVFQTYKALYGHQPVRAWIARVRGFVTCARHLMGHTNRLTKYLMDTDRDYVASQRQRRLKALRQAIGRKELASLARVLRVFSPFYDPASIPPPPDYDMVLAKYSVSQ
jgi:predicted metal-dependent hydrolase